MYENVELVRRAKNNDEQAKNELILNNSPLIKSVIKCFRNKGIEYDDLYQLGCMGFLKAITNFDESFQVKFSTYAVPMIAGEVKRFLRDNGIIKVSRNIKTLNMQINRYIDRMIKEKGQEPTIKELSENFEVTEQEIVFAMESSKMPISLYQQVGDDEGGKSLLLIDKLPSDDSLIESVDKMVLYDAIKDLSKRDRKIIILRYFRDKTQSEIAQILGVSQVQVSRLENKILEMMKKKII